MLPGSATTRGINLSFASARVLSRIQETPDTFTLTLASDLRFEPGQFNMLYAFGVGESAISVSGDPTQRGQLVHTIRAVGPVTRALTSLEPGAEIGVRGPYGTAWPVAAAQGKDLLIVAGGIGLAPLRPVIYAALAERASFGRVVLIYGARSPQDILYPSEIERWREQGIDCQVTVDRGDLDWEGNTGVVTKLVERLDVRAEHCIALLCGPEVMMRFAARGLESLGLSSQRIYASAERNMKCAVGLCGHCQLGAEFVCKDGPVFTYERLGPLLSVREL